MTVSEKKLQCDIERMAKRCGWRCYHTHDSRRSEQGFPDLVMVRRGRLVIAELKTELGKPTTAQDEWLRDLAEVHGVDVFIWRPQDMTEIEGVLK